VEITPMTSRYGTWSMNRFINDDGLHGKLQFDVKWRNPAGL